MNLYELSTDLMVLKEINDIDETERASIISLIENQILNKTESIVAVVRGLEVDINSIDEEIKRLSLLKKGKQSNLESLKRYTKECMERVGSKKVQTKLGDISIRKNPPSVSILDESKIPDDYIVIKQVTSIDRKSLLSDLKQGLILDGIAEVTQSTSLSIK